MAGAQDPTVFIGSSSEGLAIAENLQLVLDDYCEATVWNQGVFGLSGTGIGSLIKASGSYDFAVLVLTPDDLSTKRRKVQAVARDNVLFEAGLFIGAIGLERTFLVHCKDGELDLPTDLDGVTRATYRHRVDSKLRSALNPVGVEIRERMKELGPRGRGVVTLAAPTEIPEQQDRPLEEEERLLEQELNILSTSAEAHGWTVKTHSTSAYRLVAPDGVRFSLTLGEPHATRRDLRAYARELNEYGLRLSRSLLTPIGESVAEQPVTRAREKRRRR
ncbi:MAG TPA: nucleotide-binding protein [Solirubrobacterales bacterium]